MKGDIHRKMREPIHVVSHEHHDHHGHTKGGPDYLKVTFWLLLVLFIVQLFALRTSLFYVLWWADIAAHVLGGFILGVVGLWVARGVFSKRVGFSALLLALLCAAVGGILWEVLELWVGFGFDQSDTIIDFASDIIGASCAFILFRLFSRRG